MAYTPELSMKSSCTLRRLAWALDMPMTKAMDCPRSWTTKRFAGHAWTNRNVWTANSISKPEFMMKMKGGDISA